MKKICVVTGSRADFGILRWVMHGIENSPKLRLQVIATGTHLSPEFGETYRDIEAHGFHIDRKVEVILSSDTPVGVTKSMGLVLIGFADALAELQPDMMLVLGDRFEILAAASSALIACIPIAHLHGGETTEGTLDDAIRHSITKMSQLHFVATEEYRKRVVQMGESPDRVFAVGGVGIDNLIKMSLLDRSALEACLEFRLGDRNLLVTFHPATLEVGSAKVQTAELLSALESLKDTHLIFTKPNADTEGRAISQMIDEFVSRNPVTSKAYDSLGQLLYLSCMSHVDGVIGNSSSGIVEAPSLMKGTINIGDRQRGRLKAHSVIDCAPTKAEIQQAIIKLYSDDFKAALFSVVNPYGHGGASETIVKVLESHDPGSLLRKHFCDLVQVVSEISSNTEENHGI